jgi:osmoprotectant transport system permease protein
VTVAAPVIPDFGEAKGCIADNSSFFCPTWVREHWTDTLQPAIVQHLWLTAVAVGIGFAIAFAAALVAHRFGWFATPFGVFAAFLYTIPSIALFQLLVPVTGITVTTIEVGLVGYTLLILFRNTLAGLRAVPEDVLEAARGMGLTRGQILRRVELPLALPAIAAGVRIAVVTTISLATVAAYITPYGLGKPIFDGLQINYHSEYVVAGGLAILLALAADGVLVAGQRLLTPWARARRTA